MSHTHLSERERYAIEIHRQQGWSIRRIAGQINRSPSTVCRELRRNGSGTSRYAADRAHHTAVQRQHKRSSRPWKLTSTMWSEIAKGLRRGDSPDIIAGQSGPERSGRISQEWIYQQVYRDRAGGGDLWRHLLRKRKRRKQRIRGRAARGQLSNRVMISERPAEVATRGRPGDWEADSIMGQGNRSRLVSLVDRQSRYLRLLRPADGSAEATADAIIAALGTEVLRTVTVDNGKEFARHERIARELKTTVYFAEPYSPWQRGSNENINGMVRRYFPKGTDFSKVSDAEIEAVENRINNRSRKLLDYATSWEVHSGRAEPPPVAIQS